MTIKPIIRKILRIIIKVLTKIKIKIILIRIYKNKRMGGKYEKLLFF